MNDIVTVFQNGNTIIQQGRILVEAKKENNWAWLIQDVNTGSKYLINEAITIKYN